MFFHFGQLAGKVDDKTRDILLCCRREKSPKKGEKLCGFTAKLETQANREEGRKKKKNVPAPKKTPEGSRPNGNEPQGLLCFTGCSSACENLRNKAALNYLSQCPDSTHPPLAVCYYRASGAPELRFPSSPERLPDCCQPGHRLRWQVGDASRLCGASWGHREESWC